MIKFPSKCQILHKKWDAKVILLIIYTKISHFIPKTRFGTWWKYIFDLPKQLNDGDEFQMEVDQDLEFVGVQKFYGKTEAVKGISLKIEAKE